MHRIGFLALAVLVATAPAVRGQADRARLLEFFETKIRPVLAENCFSCHGPEKQKGGLRLDRKADMLGGGDSGEPAIAPGKSAESQLVARITSAKSDELMPPKGHRLTPTQIAAIQRWIDNGAH